jgi:cation channel sperm-associated protein 2
MFLIVFAVIGVNLYTDYATSREPGLNYQDYFNTVGSSLQTLFTLLTLDLWDPLNKSFATITNPVCSYIYILFWTWIGAFVFRNIFVCVMIHNFKRISTSLDQEDRIARQQIRMERARKRVKEELLAREMTKFVLLILILVISIKKEAMRAERRT